MNKVFLSILYVLVWQAFAPASIANDYNAGWQAVQARLSERLSTTDLSVAKLQDQLVAIDQALLDYVRVSERGTHFNQLKTLMPALVRLQAQQVFTQALREQDAQVPELRYSRLQRLLNSRINRLANHLVFNLVLFDRSKNQYEERMLTAMAAQDIEFSAKPPDFILDYSLVNNGMSADQTWHFFARISLLDKVERAIVSWQDDMNIQADDLTQAENQATQTMAENIAQQLTNYLMEQGEWDFLQS